MRLDKPLDLTALNEDLRIGSRGAGVRALHAYLGRYGYLPNAAVAEAYPGARPFVDELPRDIDLFDDVTERALLAFQEFAHLEPTAVADAKTRSAMLRPRCGVPDQTLADVPEELVEKYSHATARPTTSFSIGWLGALNGTTVTCPAGNGSQCASYIHSAVALAAVAWDAVSDLSYSYDDDSPDIEVRFEDIGADLGYTPYAGSLVSISKDRQWSVGFAENALPDEFYDLQTLVLHEVGHALALKHSSIGLPLAVMNGIFDEATSRRAPVLDDVVGITTLYNIFQPVTGGATAIDVGRNGDVWILGDSFSGTGYRAYKFNGSGWTAASNAQRGMKITVGPDGVPWILNGTTIYKLSSNNPTTGTWSSIAGCATDLDVGGDGSLWIIGCAATNNDVRKRNANGTYTSAGNTSSLGISVNYNGIPWVRKGNNALEQFDTSNPATGTWYSGFGSATDFDVGPVSVDGEGEDIDYGWLVGQTFQTTGYRIYAFKEQSAGTQADPPPEEENDWILVPGEATRISVGPSGKPWVVANDNTIWRYE